jgi:hypothetical protein
MIEGLKSKVGHSYMVGIGVNEAYGNLSTPWFVNSSSLFPKNVFGLLKEFPRSHLLSADSGMEIVVNSI